MQEELRQTDVAALRHLVSRWPQRQMIEYLSEDAPFLCRLIALTPSQRAKALSQHSVEKLQIALWSTWQLVVLALARENISVEVEQGNGHRPKLAGDARVAAALLAIPFPQWPFEPPDPFQE